MAKGWGAILAEAKILSEPEHPPIPCPLCGEGMEWEQVAWFCRSGPWRPSGISREPCAGDPENQEVKQMLQAAQEKFYSLPRGEGGAEDGFQFFFEPHAGTPAVHAVLIWEGKVIASAQFRRGHRGVQNFSAVAENCAPDNVVRAFEQGAKWTLAPWFEEESL